MKNKKMKNKKGFTLIELLAVIIILGILMIIAIPSVTSYINNSRKSAYVDTAKEIISGARNLVNEGKLEMFDTGTTYYIPVSCVSTENGQKSPYGDFVEDQAFVIVTYTGNNYNYFWISRDTTGQGVKTITPAGDLDEDDIKSDIEASEITPTEPAETGKNTIKVLSKDDCKTFGEGSEGSTLSQTAVDYLFENVSSSILYNIDSDNGVYIFRGGNPANYVKFNCDDNGQNCETWRIIGIYGDKLKIQSTTLTSPKQYNNSQNNNTWNGSDLETFLNQESIGGYYYGLKQSAKNMIIVGDWYAGAVNYDDNASDAYTLALTTAVNKKIGLVASYEFLFASNKSECLTKSGGSGFSSCGNSDYDWIQTNNNVWTLSPSYNNVDKALRIHLNGFVSNNSTINNYSVYPAVFLDPTVKIISGTGVDAEHAYILGK